MKIHERENLPENEVHLKVNKEKFPKQCGTVLELLMRGEKLTCRKAMLQFGIGDLRRRIKDLIDLNGVDNIEWEWEYDSDGKTTRNKIWFINHKTDQSLQSWFSQYQEEQPTTMKPKYVEQEIKFNL
jgi:hypothetical protein